MNSAIEYKAVIPDVPLYDSRGLKVMTRVWMGGLETAGALIWEKANANAPYVTGNLKDTIKSRPTVRPLGIAVGPFADYASGVERGTGPHYVPLEDLTSWAKRKFSVDDKRALGIAMKVQRNIAQWGTKGQFFMKKTLEETEGQVMRLFAGLQTKAINELRKS